MLSLSIPDQNREEEKSNTWRKDCMYENFTHNLIWIFSL